MKSDRDPMRLADPRSAVPAPLRAALLAAGDDLPPAGKLAELMAKLPRGSPPPGSPPPGSGAPAPVGPALPAAAASTSVLPGILVGAALGLVVSGGLSWLLPEPAESPPPARAEVIATAAPAATTAPAPPQTEEPAPRPEGATSPRKAGVERGAPLAAPSAGDGAEAKAEPAPSASPEVGESELTLLRRAQSALASSPSTALALATEHAARFPGGVFAQEREVLAISALAAMGRSGEARARASSLLSAHPTSAHRRRLEEIVPAIKNDSGDQKMPGPAPSTPELH